MFRLSVISTTATFDAVPSSASVDEGMTFVVNLATTGVQNGQLIPYTITGIQSADIDGESLTGSFVVQNGTAFRSFHVTEDALNEGTETMTLTLDGLGESTDIVFNDLITGDPYWNQVALLMHMDSTPYTDATGRHSTVITAGSIPLTSAVVNSGFNNSASFGADASGSNRMQVVNNIPDFRFTGDFTIEFYLRPRVYGGTYGNCIIDTRPPTLGVLTGWAMGYGYQPAGYKYSFSYPGAPVELLSNGAAVLGVWTHIAITRAGSIVYMFINGVLQTATATYSSTINASQFQMGATSNNWPTTGTAADIDELRITNGVARYTSTFTVPTTTFPDM